MIPGFERISVPFTLPELYHGFAEGHGILRVEEQALVLEYEVRDALFGVVKSGVRTLRIEWDDIESISLARRWWKRNLTIQTSRLAHAASIPGNTGGAIVLRIKRGDKPRALEAVSRLSLRMSEARLSRIENW